MSTGRLTALLGGALAPLGIFFLGWDAGSSTASCTPSNAAEWLRVPVSIALPFARALGLPSSGPALVVVLGIPVAMAWALGAQLVARRRGAVDPARVVTAVLLAFALLFGVAVALGRACLVSETTHQSRYVPLVIPGFLGLYFACASARSPRLRGALRWTLVLAFAVAEIAGRGGDLEEARRAHRNKVRWAACMVTRSDLDECTRRVGFRIHPHLRRADIPAKLAFLERGALNLYHPRLQRRLLLRARELRPPPAHLGPAPLQPAPLEPAD